MLSLRPLAEQFTLIFYDHRCNGRSEGAAVSSMTFENLTTDADALRRELGFERWAVLGHSFGGMVALEYAYRYPHRLTHLILLDTCGDTWWVQQNAPELLAKRGYSAEAVAAARDFFNGRLAPDQVTRSALKFFKAYYYRFSYLALIREMLTGPRVKMRPEAQIYGFGELLPGWSMMERLDEIETPTLVMAGRHDFQFPPEHQAILADRLPDARLEIVERAGHNAQTERPVEVMAAVRAFLAGGTFPPPDESLHE